MQELESSGFEDTEMKQLEFLRDKVATCTQLNTIEDVKTKLLQFVIALKDGYNTSEVLHDSTAKQFDAVVEVVSFDVIGVYSFLAPKSQTKSKYTSCISPSMTSI